MMILLNGPFGVGKTTTAQEIVRLLPDSMLFDPEEIGAFLRRLLGPLAAGDDYQDLALWRSLTVGLAIRVHEEFNRDLVIPMTLWRHDYLLEVTGGLRRNGIPLLQFQLVASRAVLTQRIMSRPTEDGSHEWCLAHLDAGLAMARNSDFGTTVDTSNRSLQDIVRQVITVGP
jgi:hypothetical protein